MPSPDYGFYIWSAYGVTGFVVAALLLWAVLDHRAQIRSLAELERPDADRSGRADV